MADSIDFNTWLGVMNDEYLTSYVPAGGSTIKICVGELSDRAFIASEIADRGNRLGYIVAKVDGEAVRLHRIQDIFFAVAQQIDWRNLARRAILKMAESADFQTSGIEPSNDNLYETIADLNNVSPEYVRQRMQEPFHRLLFKDPYMARDFRIAMMQLCIHERSGGNETYAGQDLINWLTNDKEKPINLRQYLIYKGSIDRTTGWHFLESLSYFLGWIGLPGLMILLDNTRAFVHPNPRDGIPYYTRAQLIDHYEVLRNFIDNVDQMIGCFAVIITDPEFLNANNDRRFSRGYGIYDALMTRVMHDVFDRDLVNPIATLVRPHVG